MNRAAISLKILEVGARDRTLDNLLHEIEQGIKSSGRRIDHAARKGEEWQPLIDDECELIEDFLGSAFVVSQVFITTVRSRVAKLSRLLEADKNKPLSFASSEKAYEIFDLAPPAAEASNYTEIRVINAVANYWKHHEEWPTRFQPKGEVLERVWDLSQSFPGLCAAKIVTSIGMSPSSSGNLRRAAEALGMTDDYDDFSPIRDKLRSWADRLVERARSEIE